MSEKYGSMSILMNGLLKILLTQTIGAQMVEKYYQEPSLGSEVLREGRMSTSEVDARLSDGNVRPTNPYLRPEPQTITSAQQSYTQDHQPPIPAPSHKEGYTIYAPKTRRPRIASTPGRKKLLQLLIERKSHITNYRYLSDELGLKVNTLRDMFSAFEKEGILYRQTIRNSEIQGMLITLLITEEKQQALLAEITSGPDLIPIPQTVCVSPLLDRKKEKNLSVLDPLVEKLLSWTDEQMEEWYPYLFGVGFRTAQIHQVVNDLHTRCKSLDLIIKSLDYAEWELAHGRMVDKEGRVVGKPASYLFTSLKQQGHYRRPQGYVDPQEKALEEEKRRQEDLLRQREAFEEKAFQNWLDSLSDKDKEEYEKERTAKAFAEPASIFMRAKWREVTGSGTKRGQFLK